MALTQVTQITLGTTVKLTRVLGNGPSTQTTTLMEDNQTVDFDSYSEGSVKLDAGVANYPLLPSSELVLIKSDKPIDVVVNPGAPDQIIIPRTKRFSIEAAEGVTVHITNPSETEAARVSFLTTNKPAVA